MIKVDGTSARISGPSVVIGAELTLLMHTLLQERFVSEDDLEFMIKLAKRSEDELQKDYDEMVRASTSDDELDKLFMAKIKELFR